MNASQSVRTRHPKEVTRATILQKAFEMYRDRELVHGDERLTVVLEALGYTTGAGYQIWANQAAFREELQVYVAENIEYASLRMIKDEVASLVEQDLGWAPHVLGAGDLYIKLFLHREEFYLTLRFFAMGDERPEAITEGIRDAYEKSTWEAAASFERALHDHGRRIRPSLTIRQMAFAVSAMLEGFALQARVRPEEISELVEFEGGMHHQFSVALLAIANHYTEPITAG